MDIPTTEAMALSDGVTTRRMEPVVGCECAACQVLRIRQADVTSQTFTERDLLVTILRELRELRAATAKAS